MHGRPRAFNILSYGAIYPIMITVISGTNRRNSKTLHFAEHYHQLLSQHSSEEVHLLDLAELPMAAYHADMYSPEGQHPEIARIQDEWLVPSDKMVYIYPEYNGGVPGALKLFIDAVSIRNRDSVFRGKKAMLTGIAAGRSGNLRGLDHLTNMLNYLGSVILPNKVPISGIGSLLHPDGEIHDEGTRAVIAKQVEQFVAF